MADARDSKSRGVTLHGGSSPPSGTIHFLEKHRTGKTQTSWGFSPRLVVIIAAFVEYVIVNRTLIGHRSQGLSWFIRDPALTEQSFEGCPQKLVSHVPMATGISGRLVTS